MKSLAAKAGAVKHSAQVANSLALAKLLQQRGVSESRESAGLLRGGAAAGSTDVVVVEEDNDDLLLSRQVTGVVQHHDSITGTSTPDVTANLDVRLRAAIQAGERILGKSTAGSTTTAIPATPTSIASSTTSSTTTTTTSQTTTTTQ